MNARLAQWICRIVAAPLLLVLVVEVAVGVWLHRRTSAFLDTAVPATGEVVELKESPGGGGRSGGGGGTTWSPVFTWTDAAGVERRSTGSVSSNPPSHAVGEAIDLLYDPQNPVDVRVDGFFSLWLGPLVLGALAAVQLLFVLTVGVALPWAFGRFWTKPEPGAESGAGLGAP